MEAPIIRQKLHQWIANGDEKLLRLLYVLAMAYNNEKDFEYEVDEEDTSPDKT